MSFKFDISKRISLGYFILIFIVSVAGTISVSRLQNNTVKYKEILNVYLPSVFNLKELEALTKESNKLIVNWIYISNKDENESLRLIQTQEYPTLKAKINQFSVSPENADLRDEQMQLLRQYDTIISFQKKIMSNLSTPQQYSNDSLVDASINILEYEIKPRYNSNQLYLTKILDKESESLKQVEVDLNYSLEYLTITMILLLILIVLIGSVASYFATKSIAKPITELKNIISTLSKGEIPTVIPAKRQDEIGEMTNAIAAMCQSIMTKAQFAKETGKGNFNNDFELLSKKDILGLALIKMRNNLRLNAKEDADRNWLNIGLAKASDILRINNTGSDEMYSDIIIFLAEYVRANAAVLFIVNDQFPDDIHFDLAASYAFETQEKIVIGRGLTGQAVLEKKTIIVNEIPDGFMKISSTMGEVSPKSIIIVPLVFENEVKGIMEFASTTCFTDLQKEFLEKNSKSIAITLVLLARKERTENLLNESRELNGKLKLNEAELKIANQELSTFIYRMSHDLRSPLTNILGLVNLSIDEKLDEKGMNYMQMVGESAKKLDKILTVLKKTMSINNKDSRIEKIDFNQLFGQILEDLKHQKETQRVKFLTNIELEDPFFSDYELLSYVLYNIVENAIKFQNHSLPESYIMIGVNKSEEELRISISDNGIGLRNDLQTKIFEMFFKGTLKENSNGLGLYVVKKVIKKLNGRIEFNSNEGTGTYVSVFLPSLEKKIKMGIRGF